MGIDWPLWPAPAYKDGTLAYKSDGFIDGGEWFIEDPMAVIKQPGNGI